MSRKDGRRDLRQLVCEGCPHHCRYADFRAHGPHAGGFAPKRIQKWNNKRRLELKAAKAAGKKLPHGNTGKRHTGQLLFADEVKNFKRDDPSKWRYHRKGTVLGSLHETKLQLWNQYTEACPLQGTDGTEEEE